MPFVPSEPSVVVVEVAVPTERAIDESRIMTLGINKDLNDADKTTVTVTWANGFRDGEGEFIVSVVTTDTFTGPELADKMNTEVNGATLYDAVKTAAWELVVAKHDLVGSIS